MTTPTWTDTGIEKRQNTNTIQQELLSLKQEISERYIKQFKDELWFLKSVTILPIESKIKKVITWEIDMPTNLADLSKSQEGDWTIKKFINNIQTWWSKLRNFLSPTTSNKVILFMKEKREELSKIQTKNELESLRASITEQQNPQSKRKDNATSQTSSSQTKWKARVNNQSETYEIDQNLSIIPSLEAQSIYNNLRWTEKPSIEPFACAFKLYNSLKWEWKLNNSEYLSVVDFTKPKGTNRFFLINMNTNTVESANKVWHWANSGWKFATQFSNRRQSNMSSLWWYIMPDTITHSPNKNRSGLRQIRWIEPTNDNSASRWIAVHPWGEWWNQWCFTLPRDIAPDIMNKMKWWSLLFAYAKSKDYFNKSNYFHPDSNGNIAA